MDNLGILLGWEVILDWEKKKQKTSVVPVFACEQGLVVAIVFFLIVLGKMFCSLEFYQGDGA